MNDALDMGLFFVHGRWYNQDTGLFLSPDEKGEYFYGSGNDAINEAWMKIQEAVPCIVDFAGGTAAQFVWDESLGLPGVFGFEPRSGECIDPGREYGRSVSTVFSTYVTAQGIFDIGSGLTGGTAALACEGASIGVCTRIAVPVGTVSIGLVLKGSAEVAWSSAVLARNQTNPLSLASGRSGNKTPIIGNAQETSDATHAARITSEAK